VTGQLLISVCRASGALCVVLSHVNSHKWHMQCARSRARIERSSKRPKKLYIYLVSAFIHVHGRLVVGPSKIHRRCQDFPKRIAPLPSETPLPALWPAWQLLR
jgi:hypothetical protein